LKRDYEARPYRPGDEGEIVELLHLVFGGWPKFDLNSSPLEHWRWKYLDNPLRRNFIVIGISNDRIIGVNQSYPLRIKIGDHVFPCVYSADTAVHPDFRRIGVYNKMTEMNISMMNEAGIRLDYFATGNPILIKSYSKKYRSFPFTILNLVLIRDIDRQLQAIPMENAWLMKLGFHVVKRIKDIRNIFIGSGTADHRIQIHRTDNFDARIGLFWKEISGNYDFIVERSGNYLNWRYCDPRAGDFIVKQVDDDDPILGYCVLRINRYLEDYPIGYIVDLLTLPDRLDVAEALAADAVRYFDDHRVNIVNYQVVKNHPYERILKRHGFMDSRIKLKLFIRSSLEEELIELKASSPDRIYFSYGDIDSLPIGLPGYR
jgi:ribosomal protein S18 acetylase RimI-like enzyme